MALDFMPSILRSTPEVFHRRVLVPAVRHEIARL